MGCVIAEMMTNHSLFEGANSTAMLSRIIKCIGSPTQSDLQNMKLKEGEVQLSEIEGSGLASRLKKLNPNCEEQLIDLVERMVVYDPTKRIAAD
jgi:serine/threonine protein kinase